MLNEMTKHFRESNDILDRKVQERTRELNISGRLASVGFLAAGVAHEINNPILAINIAAESLEYRIAPLLENLPSADRDVVFEYLHMIQQESTRCQGITGRLLEFSRGSQSTEKQPVDLTLIVNEVVGMIKHLHKFADRKIIFDHHTPTIIQASAAEMKQVILNLTSNALEATDKGGTVELKITDSSQHIELTVKDDGCGMNDAVLEHLFDPFFTQRRDGKGTGLGLSITKRIIDDHHATITPTSNGPNQGSTFLLKFPKKQPPKKPA
jgi:signal transduction histidine kinase